MSVRQRILNWLKPKSYVGFAYDKDIHFRKRLKYLWQRKTRGFDDTEVWNLDYSISEFVYPRLKEFIRVKKEHDFFQPASIDDYKDWITKLEKMLKAFELIKKDSEWLNVNPTPEESAARDKEIHEGLQLFAQYVGHLYW